MYILISTLPVSHTIHAKEYVPAKVIEYHSKINLEKFARGTRTPASRFPAQHANHCTMDTGRYRGLMMW